ncbi:hypothetical protein AXE80_05835 [Wenyingzhuangia fucanilytica]|uniref:HNH endonuclease 5 domain-containing protein n=1 Tax=Wenyingzhuangia fucanilytica TaxID=1790137 RepID=A0A1B1Y4Z7_9FLAO|nr:hypothetical protein [Wenyingzhuangia fucanilytica]ANW95830.1 hypothetical protein AXE80_05835 [Wenyingzhuangia fucanilytica]
MKKTGKCRLCGEVKKLSFEHVPPESAYNSTPVFFQDSENLHDKSSYVYGKRKRSSRGAGGMYFCVSCNNNTGGWYAKDYKEFAEIGMYVLRSRVYANKYMCAEYPIKPLNVLKQILIMFVALESSGYLIKRPGLKEFLMEPENNNLPENIRVFAYMTSTIKLRNALSFSNMDGYMRHFGEISYTPFGFHISIDTPPINKPYCEITNFAQFVYNEKAKIILPLQYLVPITYFPGLYK